MKKYKKKLVSFPIKYTSIEETRKFVKHFKEQGYKILHGLDDLDRREKIIALYLDLKLKEVFTTNITCMACYCSGKRQPITIEQLFKYYKTLIIEKDICFYNLLISKNYAMKTPNAEKDFIYNLIDEIKKYIIENPNKECMEEFEDFINLYDKNMNDNS
jgi:hypothetical protein